LLFRQLRLPQHLLEAFFRRKLPAQRLHPFGDLLGISRQPQAFGFLDDQPLFNESVEHRLTEGRGLLRIVRRRFAVFQERAHAHVDIPFGDDVVVDHGHDAVGGVARSD
jgi:hypothetical protein